MNLLLLIKVAVRRLKDFHPLEIAGMQLAALTPKALPPGEKKNNWLEN
jgi:hypothetical protein